MFENLFTLQIIIFAKQIRTKGLADLTCYDIKAYLNWVNV